MRLYVASSPGSPLLNLLDGHIKLVGCSAIPVTALQHGTWMNEESFKKTCIKEKKKRGGMHQPFYSTWVADFILRQNAGRFMLGKYLSDKKIQWHRRRRLGMAVAGNTPTASFLTKIGKMQSAGCRLCKIAREARGESTVGLADETHGHINSACCEGIATTVTAAHLSIRRNLYDRMHAARKPKSKLKFVTLDKESNIRHAVATRRVSKNLQQGRARKSWRRRHRI